jgi:hypothetical protein
MEEPPVAGSEFLVAKHSAVDRDGEFGPHSGRR